MVVAAHGHGAGTGGPGPAASRWRQARRFDDGVEPDAPSGPQQPPTGSQHGELGAQSTQHVGVDGGVEAAGAKRQPTGGGRHHGCPSGEPFFGGAVGGHAQPFQR
jgi:hypothetical protein